MKMGVLLQLQNCCIVRILMRPFFSQHFNGLSGVRLRGRGPADVQVPENRDGYDVPKEDDYSPQRLLVLWDSVSLEKVDNVKNHESKDFHGGQNMNKKERGRIERVHI